MAAQLNLPVFGIPEENRGSKPVPEPAGTSAERRFRNHLPNSSTNSRFQPVSPKGEEFSGTGSAKQALLPGESEPLSLSPLVNQRGRGLDPNEQRATPVLASGTGPEPISIRSLRGYQTDANDSAEAAWARGIKRVAVELPTGTGKTVCFAELARKVVARLLRVLVVAHRSELLKQAARKLADVGVRAGIEQASNRAGRAPVVVASVQTLRGDRLAALDPAEFGLVIVDEGHHAVARSYRAILERFRDVPVLFVSATFDRADGIGLRGIVDELVYRYELRAAIRDKWLVPIRARRIVVTGLDLSQIKLRAGDLDQRELSAVMQHEQVLHGMVSPLLEQAGSRPTIAFTVDVEHAHKTAELLNRYRPNCARAIDGEASEDEREEVLAAFARGDFQFLINCALFTEGFDEPRIACVALFRPTCSRALYCQQIGRGTRLLGLSLEESIANGKPDLLVLDFTGNTARHRLVGPADALAGGDLPEDVRAECDTDLERGQVELEEVLAHAEQIIDDKREKIRVLAIAHYRAQEVDPFLQHLPPDPDGPWAKEPATETQRRALTQAGFSKLPADLRRGEASRWITAIVERKKAGLCSLKAAKRLHSLNLNTAGMSAARAGVLFGKARKKGWRPWVFMHEPEFRRSSK